MNTEKPNFYPERDEEIYLEYKNLDDRPGLLGDILSLMGNIGLSIKTINGVEISQRALLLRTDDLWKLERFKWICEHVDEIEVGKMRTPTITDRLTLRHGRFIKRAEENKNIFRFTRDEISIVVDFLAILFDIDETFLIGVRGMPRVGKTESVVAGSVSAGDKWLFLSSTMLKQTERTSLHKQEFDKGNVYIIDGAVTSKSTNTDHKRLVNQVLNYDGTTVVEHPDLLIDDPFFKLKQEDFDYIIEIREHEDQEITYEKHKKRHWFESDNMDFF